MNGAAEFVSDFCETLEKFFSAISEVYFPTLNSSIVGNGNLKDFFDLRRALFLDQPVDKMGAI